MKKLIALAMTALAIYITASMITEIFALSLGLHYQTLFNL
jgi:hypothetical protein